MLLVGTPTTARREFFMEAFALSEGFHAQSFKVIFVKLWATLRNTEKYSKFQQTIDYLRLWCKKGKISTN